MNITVKEVEYRHGESIAVGVGETDTGETVRFAGDWRPMETIAKAIYEGEEVQVDVDAWAIL